MLAGQSPPAAKAPLLVVPNGDAGPWQAIARDLGWQLFTPSVANIAGDKGLQDFENATRAAIARPQVDDTRVYLLGNAADTPAIFYIVALVYLIFDVEVALFYPWAVAYGNAPTLAQSIGMSAQALRGVAIVDMLFFFGVLLVGFAYLWRFGYLDWVRSAANTSLKIDYEPGVDLRREARVDRARNAGEHRSLFARVVAALEKDVPWS